MNNICIVGRIGQDIETRNPGGKTVASCSVAVRRPFVKSDGVDTDWFNVEAWGKSADFLINYGSKGRLVAVSGRLESRKHEDKVYWTLKADNVSLLDRPRDDAPAGGNSVVAPGEYDPFAQED